MEIILQTSPAPPTSPKEMKNKFAYFLQNRRQNWTGLKRCQKFAKTNVCKRIHALRIFRQISDKWSTIRLHCILFPRKREGMMPWGTGIVSLLCGSTRVLQEDFMSRVLAGGQKRMPWEQSTENTESTFFDVR